MVLLNQKLFTQCLVRVYTACTQTQYALYSLPLLQRSTLFALHYYVASFIKSTVNLIGTLQHTQTYLWYYWHIKIVQLHCSLSLMQSSTLVVSQDTPLYRPPVAFPPGLSCVRGGPLQLLHESQPVFKEGNQIPLWL